MAKVPSLTKIRHFLRDTVNMSGKEASSYVKGIRNAGIKTEEEAGQLLSHLKAKYNAAGGEHLDEGISEATKKALGVKSSYNGDGLGARVYKAGSHDTHVMSGPSQRELIKEERQGKLLDRAERDYKANSNLSAAVSGSGQTQQAAAAEAGRSQQAQARAIKNANDAKAAELEKNNKLAEGASSSDGYQSAQAEATARAESTTKAEIDDDWLDNGYNAEKELGGMRKGYDQNAAPKASSRDMGATQQEIDSLKGETDIKKIRKENKEYRRKAAREKANKEDNRAWYDDEESRAFAQSQVDEEFQQLKVDWNNKSKDLDEKIAKAKKTGDVDAIEKLQDEKREAYLGYRKKREGFYEKDSEGNLIYHKDENGRDVIGRRQVDPNMLDWIRGHGYDKAAAGIGALGFAGSVAFGGAKSNADLYSNPF